MDRLLEGEHQALEDDDEDEDDVKKTKRNTSTEEFLMRLSAAQSPAGVRPSRASKGVIVVENPYANTETEMSNTDANPEPWSPASTGSSVFPQANSTDT